MTPLHQPTLWGTRVVEMQQQSKEKLRTQRKVKQSEVTQLQNRGKRGNRAKRSNAKQSKTQQVCAHPGWWDIY